MDFHYWVLLGLSVSLSLRSKVASILLVFSHSLVSVMVHQKQSTADELLPMVNSKMPLSNFVEQVACVPRSKAFSEPLGISLRSWCVFNHTNFFCESR